MSKAKYISKLVDASGSTTSANVSYTGTLTGSTDILNIGSGQLYKDASGNVGIGVTDFSSTGANAKFAISLGGINLDDAKVLSWGGGSARPYITASKSSAYLAMGVSGTERMRIDSSGNVGIGTSSPAGAKLRLNQPSGVYGPSTPLQSWAYANAQVTNLQIDGSVNPVWNTDADSTWAQTATMIWQYRGSEKMRIDSSGNVGIGTSSPAARLHAYGSTTNASIIRTELGGGADGVYFEIKGGVNYRALAAYTSAGAIDWAVGQYGTATGQNLAFYTGTTERMRIDSSGNVGIGSSSDNPTPAAPLHITAGTAQTAVVTAVTTQLRLARSGTGGVKYSTQADFKLGTYATGINSQTQLDIALGNGATNTPDVTVMTLLGSGNVGIGTSNPVCKLHVYSSTAQNATYGFVHIESPIAASDATSNASYTAKNYSGTSQFMQWENYGLRIGSRIITNTGAGHVIFTTGNDVERMRIDSSGRITTPSQPAFKAYASTGVSNYTTGGTKITAYDTTTFNIGGHYSTVNKRFTAPIAGVYMFAARAWAAGGNTTGAGINITVNGTGVIATVRIATSSGDYSTMNPFTEVYLNANDYVEVFTETCTATGQVHISQGEAYSGFTGYFLG